METTKALRAHAFLTGDLEGLKAQQKSAMPYNELIDFMQQRGFTPSAAADVVARLERSGSLLNLHGTILLQPGEVAHALAMVLPSSLSAARQQLEVARQELAALDSQQSKIKRRAIWRHRLFLSGGLSSQILIWGLLFRLTYYELSWDVMEPICFFVGGGQAIMAYTFFMMTRSEFSWEKALDRYVGKWEATQLQRAAFDVQRYTFLRAECSRLEDVVRAGERAELEAAARVKDHAKRGSSTPNASHNN
ncbi:hypothetical protein D9Q98_010422 [Chlorella vulgaris]|uniref:Calcium uniporter protein C-terminal domain-containing protein n=1 Tax=Chlorella vulgaris TaxID=3077 RepID=A0A9D4TRS0_CHLVU|nr:hypothetical protein D9Q98_010422 [Chlorella vulgaris]